MIFARPLRQLPVVQVDGVRYIVDVQLGLLRQVDRPERVVWFVREQDEDGS
jgi:hypothetical protein